MTHLYVPASQMVYFSIKLLFGTKELLDLGNNDEDFPTCSGILKRKQLINVTCKGPW